MTLQLLPMTEHCLFHLSNGSFYSDKSCPTNNGMTNIEFFHPFKTSNRVNVPVGETVTGVDPDASSTRLLASFG
jgi:hypothetical protein